jgi:phosphoribosylamine-glycine ligase
VRILLLSHEGDGVWLVPVLERAGHEVAWAIKDTKYADVLKGIASPPLDEIPDHSDADLIVFDECSDGKVADRMRRDTPVIGSSEFAENLEEDRIFGLEFMEKAGIKVPPWEGFDDVGKATKWIKKHNQRCVFKPSGHVVDKAATYVSKDAEDMCDYLDKLTDKIKGNDFILQEFVEGTEVSTNAWFNGQDFFAIDHTLEEKKFMSGGIGPNIGCAGNIVWMPRGPDRLFNLGLGKVREQLIEANFVGPIDLNTICTEGEAFGLEWTPRFGYEGTCNTMALLPMEFGEFMYLIATGQHVGITSSKADFSATIRVSVPPYPNEVNNRKRYEGIPIHGIEPDDIESFYLSEVQLVDGELQTVGLDGIIGAPITTGHSIKEAVEVCEARIKKLKIPDLMWRNDIGKCCEKRYNALERNGWLKVSHAANA